MHLLVLQRLFIEAAFDIVYFPIWWFTGGVAYAARICFGLLKKGNESLAPGLWMRNIFVPMFGQYDFQGRLISFVMRTVQIIVRSAVLCAWLIVCLLLFLLWIAFPMAVTYALILSVK